MWLEYMKVNHWRFWFCCEQIISMSLLGHAFNNCPQQLFNNCPLPVSIFNIFFNMLSCNMLGHLCVCLSRKSNLLGHWLVPWEFWILGHRGVTGVSARLCDLHFVRGAIAVVTDVSIKGLTSPSRHLLYL